jgi:hypothetical protein
MRPKCAGPSLSEQMRCAADCIRWHAPTLKEQFLALISDFVVLHEGGEISKVLARPSERLELTLRRWP